jgi:hypothetical protein
MRGLGVAALLAGLAGLVACAAPPRGPPRLSDADYPGLLRSATELPGDLLWRQRVTATWGDARPRSFDAALQKQGDTLTLIGLSPLGTTAFVVVLRDGAIDFREESGEDLPFPPRFILLDVQRVFYPWLPPGQREGLVGDERVVEDFVDGRLAERRFTRLDGQPAGTITVRYEWGGQAWRAPVRAELDNGWFGYRLTVVTLDETQLPPAAPAAGSPR